MEDKTMKRMILGTMMCVLMTSAVSAQMQRPIPQDGKKQVCKYDGEGMVKFTPEQAAEQKTRFVSERLTLTSKQSKKLGKIFLDEAKALDVVNANGGNPAEVKAKTDKKVKKVLTAEQFAKYEELGRQRHETICRNKPMHRHDEFHHRHNDMRDQPERFRPKHHALPDEHKVHPRNDMAPEQMKP